MEMQTIMANAWSKSKLLIKALIIGVLVLVLQIPMFYVQDLVQERQARQEEAIMEVSSKWAGKQTLTGPVVVLPYWKNVTKDTANKTGRIKSYAYFLPDDLLVDASVTPHEKYRGIYKVMLYTSQINISGAFNNIDPAKLQIPNEDVIWNESYVRLNISDAKGLNDELNLQWNNQLLPLAPFVSEVHGADDAFSAPLNITGIEQLKNIRFATHINLNGSGQILFTPIGKTTGVRLQSAWPNPSFKGNMLPQTTAIKNSGFTAQWKSLAHKRNFPQQWKDDNFLLEKTNTAATEVDNSINNTAFGVDLLIPVNNYQKTMRSVKYAALCMILTFAAFFLIETSTKKSVHPFQYGLIGLALILFYTLLLSFSEYTGFNIAYFIASVCTIGLITWFVKGLLNAARSTTIIAAVLTLMYTYVFTILQLQDYALLFGSIGLFITLAVVMYFSRKIQW